MRLASDACTAKDTLSESIQPANPDWDGLHWTPHNKNLSDGDGKDHGNTSQDHNKNRHLHCTNHETSNNISADDMQICSEQPRYKGVKTVRRVGQLTARKLGSVQPMKIIAQLPPVPIKTD